MKRFSMLTVLSLVVLVAGGELLARGGRGGGGISRGGGGGYSRPSVSRSPAVSRPTPRPSTPSISRPATPAVSRPNVTPPRVSAPVAGTRPGTGVGARPSAGQLQDFLDVRPGGPTAGALPAGRPGNLAGAVAGGAAGGAAAEFLRDSGARPSNLPAGGQRPGVDAGDRPSLADRPAVANRPDRIENRQEWSANRTERRNEIRQHCDDHPIRDFWADNPLWGAWAITRPFRWATWGGVVGWVNYGWTDPAYYNYGENVYYGDQAVCSAEEYAQQAEAIAASAPETVPDNAQWMSLGVFALSQDGQKAGPEPTLFLQLVISKEGILSGTLHNTTNNTTQNIEGMVDKASQRAAWNVAGKSRPIMETGMNNLTQDSSPALIHFADGQTQQWLMVRLNEPQTGTATP